MSKEKWLRALQVAHPSAVTLALPWDMHEAEQAKRPQAELLLRIAPKTTKGVLP
jgi:hypothetical protein